MDIQIDKSILIERLKSVNDASLLQAIKSILDFGLKDKEGRSDSNRISIEQYNQELDKAEKDIADGLGMSHEKFEQEAQKW